MKFDGIGYIRTGIGANTIEFDSYRRSKPGSVHIRGVELPQIVPAERRIGNPPFFGEHEK